MKDRSLVVILVAVGRNVIPGFSSFVIGLLHLLACFLLLFKRYVTLSRKDCHKKYT